MTTAFGDPPERPISAVDPRTMPLRGATCAAAKPAARNDSSWSPESGSDSTTRNSGRTDGSE